MGNTDENVNILLILNRKKQPCKAMYFTSIQSWQKKKKKKKKRKKDSNYFKNSKNYNIAVQILKLFTPK